MPGGDLTIDSALLRAAQGNFTDLVGSIPQHSVVDVAGCGSTDVIRAVADFDLWAVLTGRIGTERFQALASDAGAVADEGGSAGCAVRGRVGELTVAERRTTDNPGSVDVGVLQSAITDLTTASSAYSDAKRSAQTISATLDGWSGHAADAWRASSAELANELDTHRQRLLDAKSALSQYRSTCLDINNRASVHRAAVSDAMRVLSSDPPRLDVDDYDERQQDYYRWQMKQQQARDDQSYAYSMLVAIADKRRDAAPGDPSALPTAFEKVVTLQGIADGAGVGSGLGVAERSDAELRETIDTVTGGVESLIGFIPIPGSSAAGGTVGLVGGYGIDAWADNWYSADQSYPDAASRAASLEHLGEGGLPGQLASMIYAQCGESLGLTPPPPSQAGSYAYDTWVASTLDDIAVNHGVNSGNLIDGSQQAFSAGSGEARG